MIEPGKIMFIDSLGSPLILPLLGFHPKINLFKVSKANKDGTVGGGGSTKEVVQESVRSSSYKIQYPSRRYKLTHLLFLGTTLVEVLATSLV